MAKKNVAENKKIENKTQIDKLGTFISSYKIPLIAIVCVVVLAFVGFVVFEKVYGSVKASNLTAVEKIEYTLSLDAAGLSDEELTARYDAALTSLEAYTKKGGIAGARANLLAAEILFRKNNFSSALENYLAAAKKTKGTYLAPICYFNAAIACEELNENEKALEYYQIAADDKEFADPTHALFSVGRLKEKALDYKGAKEAYEKITAKNNSQDPWSNLAKTRILSMQVEGKTE
ncbi:tetratricopeptide repeat protein [Treponema sp.]|uniref:tetratricopeptide repeat protein n=1 Tax=Treponema sp. TaxID=166 RepID=UPI00298DADE2|nr:tetratricopeptide repeat protein [Treponema sp.]MCR5613610.1 tetratricopeptide repeat protein [Treponema sp.]